MLTIVTALLMGSLDWKHLQRLVMGNSRFLSNMALQPHCLRYLKISAVSASDKTPLSDILLLCERLEVLDLGDFTTLIGFQDGRVLKHLGNNLESLRLHGNVPLEQQYDQLYLQREDLQMIAKHCPKLCGLGLDLRCVRELVRGLVRGSIAMLTIVRSKPYQTLNHLASHLWFLGPLDVNLDLKIFGPHRNRGPKPTLEIAEHLWIYIRRQIRRSRLQRQHSRTEPRLLTLDVTAGPFRPLCLGGHYTVHFRDEDVEQQRYRVDISEHEQKAGKDEASITCVELEAVRSKLGSGY